MSVSGLAALDRSIFEALNAFVGQSWLFDGMIAAALDNPVVKAGPLGACFLFAWYVNKGRNSLTTRRQLLIVTLLSMFLIAPTSKLLSESSMSPRPYVRAEQVYLYHDEAIAELPAIEVNAIQTGQVSGRIAAVRDGQLHKNDLDGFPSDHAALYFALALGIFLACRGAGIFSISWAVIVIFIPRIAVGLHWPSDIIAGIILGSALLLSLQFVFSRFGERHWEKAIGWTERHPALVASMLFLTLIETISTMPTLERAREIGRVLVERLL